MITEKEGKVDLTGLRNLINESTEQNSKGLPNNQEGFGSFLNTLHFDNGVLGSGGKTSKQLQLMSGIWTYRHYYSARMYSGHKNGKNTILSVA